MREKNKDRGGILFKLCLGEILAKALYSCDRIHSACSFLSYYPRLEWRLLKSVQVSSENRYN